MKTCRWLVSVEASMDQWWMELELCWNRCNSIGSLHSSWWRCIALRKGTFTAYWIWHFGWWQYLVQKFDAEITLDRGYHIATVIKYLSQLGVRWLGTHSEKINDWPFSSNASEKTQSQELVSRDGAPHAAWATRKIHRVDTHAVCYRNGSGGIGNVHFSDSTLYGLWDLKCSLPIGKGKNDIVKDPNEHGSIQETLFKSWNEYVLELTSVQAVCSWFDMRTGFSPVQQTRTQLLLSSLLCLLMINMENVFYHCSRF